MASECRLEFGPSSHVTDWASVADRATSNVAAAMHLQESATADVQSGIFDRRLLGRRNGLSKLANSDRPGNAPGP